MADAKSIGFIGGGRVCRILLEGWRRRGALPAKLVVADRDQATLELLRARFPAIEPAPAAVAAAQDVVFLALPAAALAEAGAQLSACLKPGALVVSLAPTLTFVKLAAALGGFERLARANPNAPSAVNAGFIPIAFSPALTAADRTALFTLFGPLGQCPEVLESKLEGYVLLTGLGPTYLWYQLQALREVAAGFGLTEAEIAPALEAMVEGAARTLVGAGLPPAEVMDLVPLRPLAELEAQVAALYRTRLPALYEKLKP